MSENIGIRIYPQDGGPRKKDPHAEERLQHAIRHAFPNGQGVVIERDGSIRLEPPEPALPAFRPDYGGYVYLIKVRGFALAKIGYSTDPERRLAELGAGSGMGNGLELLVYFPGDGYLERELHAKFAADRLFGEWFQFSDEIREWLGQKAAELLT